MVCNFFGPICDNWRKCAYAGEKDQKSAFFWLVLLNKGRCNTELWFFLFYFSSGLTVCVLILNPLFVFWIDASYNAKCLPVLQNPFRVDETCHLSKMDCDDAENASGLACITRPIAADVFRVRYLYTRRLWPINATLVTYPRWAISSGSTRYFLKYTSLLKLLSYSCALYSSWWLPGFLHWTASANRFMKLKAGEEVANILYNISVVAVNVAGLWHYCPL